MVLYDTANALIYFNHKGEVGGITFPGESESDVPSDDTMQLQVLMKQIGEICEAILLL